MFDADGTVTFKNYAPKKNGYPQITISVTQKEKIIVMAYYNVFGGSIYFDKSQSGYWKWRVQSKKMYLK